MVKAILTEAEFNALPEQVAIPRAQAYAKNGEGYVFQVEPVNGYELRPVANLMSALDKERTAREAADGRVKAFEGLDPKLARDALATVEEYKKADPEARAKRAFEATTKQLQEEHAKALAAEQARAKQLMAQIERQVRTAAAHAAIAKSKGNVALLAPHVESRIRTEANAQGEIVAFVVDEQGNKANMLQGAAVVPMSIEHLVETMKAQDSFASAFEGTGARGSGGGAHGGVGAVGHTIPESVVRNDFKAYEAAKARAAAAKMPLTVVAG